jgi:lysophospholipase L1-like esterase
MILQADDHILFYGDSITDAGRNAEQNSNGGLGAGYAALVAAQLAARFPELNLRFTNRGLSGNRVYDLESRLRDDVISQQPSLVSILIGINDTWRRYDSNTMSPLDEFEASYARIAQRLHESGTSRLIICEPFLLPVPDDRIAWREDLDPRIAACRRIARQHGGLYLPLDGLFAAAACRQTLDYWLPDGVHPSLAGHAFIADAWMNLVTNSNL